MTLHAGPMRWGARAQWEIRDERRVDVISQTRHLQTIEPLLGITTAGAEIRVRAIRRLSTIS